MENLKQENERLRVRCDRLAQIATASVGLADMVSDAYPLAGAILEARDRIETDEPPESEVGAITGERDELVDLARELAVALEDPDTGQCHACGAVLTHEQHEADCPAARFVRRWNHG